MSRHLPLQAERMHQADYHGPAWGRLGVFGLRGITGSTHLFVSESAASQSFFSGSTELATFYDIPTYYTVKHMFYEYDQLPNRQSISNRYAPFVFNPPNMFYPYNRPSGSLRNIKPIHDHINVITLPQSHFGENIKPKFTHASSPRTLQGANMRLDFKAILPEINQD